MFSPKAVLFLSYLSLAWYFASGVDFSVIINYPRTNVEKSCSPVKHFKDDTTEVPRRNQYITDFWSMYPLNILNNSKHISLACRLAFAKYLVLLKESDIGATKMFDATAKLPSGILRGNVNQYGDFDECMEVKDAQYCLAEIDIQHLWTETLEKFKDLVHSHLPFRETLEDPKHRVPGFTMIRWGFCIPKECSNVDLEEAIYEKTGAVSRVEQSMCQKSYEGKPSDSLGKTIARSFFATILVMTFLATLLEHFGIKYNGCFLRRLFDCFSLQKNFSDLSDMKCNFNEIKCLHGVRGLSALALLISHKVMALLYNPYINRTEMSAAFAQRWSVIGRTAILYTECFMLISGLLNANSLFSDLDKTGHIHLMNRLMHRLSRILPNLVAVILFCTYILPELGSGPLWPLVIEHHSELCKKYMWRNMIFIHNYYGFEKMCLTHTHQVGIDMQLFLITPIFVYLLWKNRKLGLWTIGVTALLSTILRFHVTWTNELSHVVHFGIPISRMFKTADLSYILPTHRATIYLMGVCLAYILRYTHRRIRFSKRQCYILWAIMYVVALYAWFGPVKMCIIGFRYNKMDAAIYAALSPILWGAGVAWVIYAVDSGFGNWFSPILNWNYFIPFTKIAYAVYLVQFPVFFYNIGRTKHIGEYKLYMMLEVVETLVIISISALLTLTIEMPFQNLRKLFFQRGQLIQSNLGQIVHVSADIKTKTKDREVIMKTELNYTRESKLG